MRDLGDVLQVLVAVVLGWLAARAANEAIFAAVSGRAWWPWALASAVAACGVVVVYRFARYGHLRRTR